jgi:hypothetical protein
MSCKADEEGHSSAMTDEDNAADRLAGHAQQSIGLSDTL